MKTQLNFSKNKGERECFLALNRLPAILYDEEASWILGFNVEDVGTLVAKGLLKPLGHPGKGDTKRFARDHILALRQEEAWLNKATAAIYASRRNAEEPDRPSRTPTAVASTKPSKSAVSGKSGPKLQQVELLPWTPPVEGDGKTVE